MSSSSDGKNSDGEETATEQAEGEESSEEHELKDTDVIGRQMEVPGIKWGKNYAGKTYTGVIQELVTMKFSGYKYYTVKFPGSHVEKFSSWDLKDFNAITEKEYMALQAMPGHV